MKEQLVIEQQQQTNFFGALGAGSLSAYRLHEAALLWMPDATGDSWRNVSRHCLVEQGRVAMFAQRLHFSEDLTQDLLHAAAAHDFFKRIEQDIAKEGGYTWESYEKASRTATDLMRLAGKTLPAINERVIRLANAVGHGSLREIESILEKPSLSEDDVAFLVMHYVDDYTRGDQWIKPAEVDLSIDPSGMPMNELDRRIAKNLKNAEPGKQYERLNVDGIGKFTDKTETTFQAQRRIGHRVEETLIRVLADRGYHVAPLDLPEFIDNDIRSTIEATPVRYIITREEATQFGTTITSVLENIKDNKLRFQERMVTLPTAAAVQQEYRCYFEENTFAINSIDETELVEVIAHPSGLLYPEDYREIRYQNTALDPRTQEVQFGIRPEQEGEENRWIAENFAVRNFDTSFISLSRYPPRKHVLNTLPFILERIRSLTQIISGVNTQT